MLGIPGLGLAAKTAGLDYCLMCVHACPVIDILVTIDPYQTHQ
jgi:hypothetical protein